jgi:hypothetical protein
MKKTLQECKEIVAKEYGYENWKLIRSKTLIGHLEKHYIEAYSDLANKMYYEQSEWIRVEDRLPEKHKYVLVLEYIEGISVSVILLASWEGDRWRIYGGSTAEKVTHWAELPSPPKQ